MANKESIHLHIGASRTATTSLQRHVFPMLTHHLFLGKDAGAKFRQGAPSLAVCAQLLERELPAIGTTSLSPELRYAIYRLVASYGRNTDDFELQAFLRCCLIQLIEAAEQLSLQGLVLSMELLSESPASLNGENHTDLSVPPYTALAKLCAEITGTQTHLIVVFRDPIPYLASRFFRCHRQRVSLGRSPLTPRQYLDNQSILEANQPFLSALSTAKHASYLRECRRHGRVTAVGFRQLLNTQDVLAAFDIPEECSISLRDYHPENEASASAELTAKIQKQIASDLKSMGLLAEILANQLYE